MKKTLVIMITAFSMLANVQAQQNNTRVGPGKFKPTDESLKQYQYPDWFRDAKFGIWSHWGPQAVPRQLVRQKYVCAGQWPEQVSYCALWYSL